MKHIKLYLFLMMIVSITLCSCMKNLDTAPQTFQTNIDKFSDLQAALAAAYNGLKAEEYYGGNFLTPMAWSCLPDLMGDDFVEALESTGNWRQMAEWRYNTDEGIIAGAFAQAYRIIASANDVLQNVNRFKSGTTEAGAGQIQAQALALRAHCHFDLMRYFAQSYQRNSDSLGVPYITAFSPDNPLEARPARNTVKQCYDSIYADLSEAQALFDQYGDIDNNNRFYIDEMAIHAMLARINLYNGQYAEAEAEATIIIDHFPLANQLEFPEIWKDNSTAEIVWQVPSDQEMQPGFATAGDNAPYRVANDFRDLVYSPAGGVRSHPDLIQTNIEGIGGVMRTLLYKYDGTKNFKVFRAGEMYLIRAESKYMQNMGEGLDDVNALRDARGAATGTETGAGVWTAIMNERRLELIGEGHRWFDIKRTTRAITRNECGSAGGTHSDICSVGPDSRSWIWPIPFNEININSNLEQNPDY